MAKLGLSIEIDSAAIMAKFAQANGIVDAEIILLNERFIKKAENIARNQISLHVYALPQAPGTTYERTMALQNGVVGKVEGFIGLLYIDKSVVSPQGFFYPDSVEFGLKTRPAYFARHFWAFTKAITHSEYFRDGILARSVMIKRVMV